MTLTIWGEHLDPAAPLPEYPRPQLVRDSWLNLNGRWDYAITPLSKPLLTPPDTPLTPHPDAADPLAVDDPCSPPATWDGQIVVPFSPETVLSGVGRTLSPEQTLWYRRSFPFPPLTADERVLLHFGAVDQSCRVAVNGIEVGGHSGGYLPFTLDITTALGTSALSSTAVGATAANTAAGGGDEGVLIDIVVAVRDVTDSSWLSRGKQKSERGGIWYTPQSGIWQTVWLEVVPRVAIDSLQFLPDLSTGAVEVIIGSTHAPADATAQLTVRMPGSDAVVAAASVPVDVPTPVRLRELHLWSPEHPFLYEVTVELGTDSVRSYFGMRSFSRGRDSRGHSRLLLNGEPYLPVGLLDQGYWPDGGYTAPSDEALIYDIELARRMGFTMLRKHIKVEPMRWYHHCDQLGMLVWQDAVNGGGDYRRTVVQLPAVLGSHRSDSNHARFARADERGRTAFEAELTEMVEHLRSVPSIALWVPFNEAWGQFDAARVAAQLHELDPSRPIDHASGWHDQGAGDLLSRHIYFRPIRVPRRWRRDGRVIAVTEYGGYAWEVPEHCWGDAVFGYRRYDAAAALEQAFVRLHEREVEPAVRQGLAATVYTQLSDVEDEVNGLVTYDRRVVKVPEDAVRAVNDRLRAAAT